MKMIVNLLILVLCASLYNTSLAQTSTNDIKSAQQLVDAQQKVFRDFLMMSSINADSKKDLQKFAVNDVNSIQNNLQFLATAARDKRIKGIRSLSFFMKELQQQLKEKKLNEKDIPIVLKKYKQTLTDLLSKRVDDPVEKNFRDVDWKSIQLLANSFWEFDEAKQMTDMSAYKRVIETPEYIFSFLETKPQFYYTDLLVAFISRNYPEQLLSYIQKNNNAVTTSIRNNKNLLVQQLVALSSNSLATELAPFTEQIANNELSIDDILTKRKKVDEYFQLLVNTVMNNGQKAEQGDEPVFQKALYNALAEKSLDFYVKKLNDLHSSADAVRFQSVQALRPQDLYYIIISADEEMYTSTYLGLYRRLISHFKNQSADSILTLVHSDKFRKFMRIAATYNTLTDFLHLMSQDKSKSLVHSFIADIETTDEDEAVANATDIADAFITLSKDPVFDEYVKQELEDGLRKSKRNDQYQSQQLYSILQRVYHLTTDEQSSNSFSANYKKLSLSSLTGKDGVVSELALFYGDEDGRSSFTSFMNLFKDKSQWDVTTNDSWVTVSSLQGQPIKIYANLPLKSEDEKDIAAQQELSDYLEKQSIQPSILIHRGHSYHLPNTLKYLNTSVKLAILGSCGGYKNMKKIMELNPDVHIIASKQVGSMAVNDPLLRYLNNQILESKSLDWVSFWSELDQTFKKDANASKLFEEYIPPYKNVGSYVIRLYNYHDESVASRQ